ncbi:sodium- and chloride-dependent GABA transporter 2-like [Pecten maximus]|uniref:sodium- and chloride-dependent GABA transporter 2-like n=1 Tax=Pecten maximus TaxID=6579 RepID=UPI001458695A|nr:sodium- and chloride-dependent GABA transporter 2-like [Pecten maximus]
MSLQLYEERSISSFFVKPTTCDRHTCSQQTEIFHTSRKPRLQKCAQVVYEDDEGSFLVAFLCILVICGIPTYFIDLVMGQFSGKTSFHAWQICPLLQGIGAGALFVLFVVNTYYNLIIAWTLFYLGCSFFSPLPWTSCENDWNTANCSTNRTGESFEKVHQYTNGSNTTNVSQTSSNFKLVTSEEEFWRYRLLEISPGIEEIGNMPWHLVVCFLAAWLLTFLCLIRGVRSSGKVVYVTALLPYVILTAILIRAVLLPGAGEGILYLLTPNLQKLVEPQNNGKSARAKIKKKSARLA